ncbi:MAG TPA: hypothetical protein VLA77_03605 [Candidatus Saccharimonadales bacterium]|nr:hypothetical protein [Candidatus Saccharimonadales bacterium]
MKRTLRDFVISVAITTTMLLTACGPEDLTPRVMEYPISDKQAADVQAQFPGIVGAGFQVRRSGTIYRTTDNTLRSWITWENPVTNWKIRTFIQDDPADGAALVVRNEPRMELRVELDGKTYACSAGVVPGSLTKGMLGKLVALKPTDDPSKWVIDGNHWSCREVDGSAV